MKDCWKRLQMIKAYNIHETTDTNFKCGGVAKLLTILPRLRSCVVLSTDQGLGGEYGIYFRVNIE